MRKDALCAAAIAALVMTTPATASTGGATAPADLPPSGGAPAADPVPPPSGASPLLSQFSISRARVYAYGPAARVTYRVDAPAAQVPVTLSVTATSGATRTISLGTVATGVAHVYRLHGEALPSGRLTVRLRAPGLRTGPHASVAAGSLTSYSHRFPLAGAFTWPSSGGQFGAGRPGHIHQGFDLLARDGTPVLAPRGGTITYVAYQAAGAGYYVVLSGAGEGYDYAFMHLAPGSTLVHVGQKVTTGQRLADVGHTGDAEGPHLHFEVWRGMWPGGGKPVDPQPLLRRWLPWSR
jgi:murein DD-endopeptidase MepM/ murein hydrolase activator NlpD